MKLIRELIGAELRSARVSQGLSLRNLAATANVSPAHLSELERGLTEASSELISVLCNELGFTTSGLLNRAAVRGRLAEAGTGLIAVTDDELAA